MFWAVLCCKGLDLSDGLFKVVEAKLGERDP